MSIVDAPVPEVPTVSTPPLGRAIIQPRCNVPAMVHMDGSHSIYSTLILANPSLTPPRVSHISNACHRHLLPFPCAVSQAADGGRRRVLVQSNKALPAPPALNPIDPDHVRPRHRLDETLGNRDVVFGGHSRTNTSLCLSRNFVCARPEDQ